MQAEPPPPTAIVAPADDSAVIEIVGTRSDQAQKIDRRTYRVKDNAQAAQSDTLQLLRGLPAIVITPDDEILLLGSGSVSVLVDERPIQGDTTQYLRTLRGSDIERIEIITNPSAQYAAQGSGGIINIVLRRKRADGVTGTASLLGSSHGRGEGSATVKVKRGKWGFEGQAEATVGRFAPSKFRSVRTIEQPDGTTSINSANGHSSTRFDNVYLNGKMSYEVSPGPACRSAWAAVLPNSNCDPTPITSVWLVISRPSGRTSAAAGRAIFNSLSSTSTHKGKVDGETLKASLSGYAFNSHSFTSSQYDDGGGFSFDSSDRQKGVDAKIDWVHPIGTTRILSTGAKIEFYSSNRDIQAATLLSDGTLQFMTDDAFTTRDLISAAYATYQMKSGKWTVMPGVRLERFDRLIISPGRPSVTVNRTSLFPSFHLERPLGKKISLTMSYARRTDRPSPSLLRPYLTQRGPLFFERGNPELRDQTTDSYELNLAYRHKNLNLGMILYDRETDDLWDFSFAVDDDGNIVSTAINAGQKSNRGAQIDIGLPLLARVKGTASVNLFHSLVPFDTQSGTARFNQFRYTANATVNWQGKDGPKRPGPIGQLQLEYQSPSRLFQFALWRARLGQFVLHPQSVENACGHRIGQWPRLGEKHPPPVLARHPGADRHEDAPARGQAEAGQDVRAEA